jgi:hypothetical protein
MANHMIKDKSVFAVASLVFGLCGLLAWLMPRIGFPVALLGLASGAGGYDSSRKNTAVAGLILSVIALIFTIVNWSVGDLIGSKW